VIADEIHGDFVFPPHQYTPFLNATSIGSQNAAACISPAKTFNISGIVDAIAVIPDKVNQDQFHEFAHRYQINKVNVFTSIATEVAYREGTEWLDELLTYTKGNVDLIQEHLEKNTNTLSLVQPEGTFLVWIDFRELGFGVKELARFLAEEAGLALSPGYWFGREGAGFARMTIGCLRETVQRALDQLIDAVNRN
jgi:cystathionine beta-lyase